MEILKLLVLIVALVAKVYCGLESSKGDDLDHLSDNSWQDESSENSLANRVADLLKRSKSQQFHGLMGRSSGVPESVRLGRKRNKGEMFVGLMGRRSSSGELQDEWGKPRVY